MNQKAQYQLNKSNIAIENLEQALASINYYKDKIEQTLYILKNFKVGDEQTGELSTVDSQFLKNASFMAEQFARDEECNGNTNLATFSSLNDCVVQYNAYLESKKLSYETIDEDDGYHD